MQLHPRLVYLLLSCLWLFVCSSNTKAARLYGKVTNKQNQPLPFANIYVKGTTTGTTTNEHGYYTLELLPGNYEIVFHYIGYEKLTRQVSIGMIDYEMNVQLEEEAIMLSEVVISAKEDPAYAIMRQAIAKRNFHYNQVKEYRCKVYVKGLNRILSAPDKILGFSLSSMGILDTNNSGIIYLSESVSEFSFQKPDRVKENIIASKVSGSSDNFSWNSASDFNIIDFYKNSVHIDFISDRVFISPLADNAMFYYRYRLVNTFTEDNRLIHHIEVIPRRKADPVYSGSIYIVDNLFNIHSLELMLTKNSQLKFIDTLKISQTFVPVKDDIWMPLNKRFDVKFQILKIKAEGYYLAIYKDYELNPGFDKKYFTNETLHIEEESNRKDEAFWYATRPVPLTPIETEDYQKKAAIEAMRKSKTYLDSLDKKANRFSPVQLLLGYNFRKSFHKFSFHTSPVIEMLNFNTVEGYNISFNIQFEKELMQKKILRFTPAFRYGTSNRLFCATLNSSFFYNRKNSGHVNIDFGQYVYQFNRNQPITELINTVYTLLAEQNFMKIYLEQYIAALHRIEVINGLMLWTSAGYSRRIPLNNTDVKSWTDRKNTQFTPNIPDHPFMNGIQFKQHDAFNIKIDLRYRPRQKYVSRPDMKIPLESKWPQFSVSYKKSVPGVFKSELNYDWLQFKIEDLIQLKLLGNTKYMLRTGLFLNKNRLQFMDLKHFNGNQTIIGRNYFDGFQVLDYYTASTYSPYYEAHLEHHFEGFFLNKIPLVRKLKFQEVLGFHFLYNNNFQDWTEISAGIENILRVFRIDFVTGLSRHHSTRFGVRVGMLLNQL